MPARIYAPRRVTTLDDIWDFAWCGDIEPDAVGASNLQFNEAQAVPGCFDASRAHPGARGIGAYRRSLTTEAADCHRLVFDAVNHWCRVIVDGSMISDHSGGFSRFSVDLGRLEPGDHELVVLVDNRDLPGRSPTHRDYYDWYPWGGITRSVTLHSLRRVWIDDLRLDTLSVAPPRVRLTIAIGGSPSSEDRLTVAEETSNTSDVVSIAPNTAIVEHVIEMPDAPLWSPVSPNLLTFRVAIGEDEVSLRTGLRMVDCSGGKVRINGESVRLVGVGRHEFHPDFGAALPDQVVADDVELLRELGVTFVRGAHYPQDERFLDLCDEAGICVWVEATGWQNHTGQLNDEHFLSCVEQNIDEMVAVAANHPSVILWGLLNEGTTNDPTCRPGYERLIGRIRANDSTRPVTYASNHAADDLMLDLVDVVSINEYCGWYYGSIDEIPEAFDRDIEAIEAAGYGAKPILFSEFGAEGIPGWHDPHRDRWSEEHQAAHLDACLGHLLQTRADRVAGALIWVFADFRSSPAMPRLLGRAGSYNHKGVVDRYRNPKLVTETVRHHFRTDRVFGTSQSCGSGGFGQPQSR